MKLAQWALGATSLLGLAVAAAPAKSPTPADVRFAFAWPAPGAVTVIQTRSTERNGTRHGAQALSYRLSLRPGESGYVVVPDTFEIVMPGATPDAPARREPLPFQYAQAAAIAFRVDRDGRFATLDDLPRAQAALRATIRAADRPPADGAANARQQEAVAAATSPEALENAARDYWDPIVGNWAGTQFAFDTAYEFDEQLSLPVPLPGVGPMPAKAQVYVRRAPPCERGGRPQRCVYVELQVQLDRKAIDALMANLSQQSPGGQPPLREASIVSTSTLLVEPETLIPHEYEYERAARFVLGDPATQGEVSIVESDRREFRHGP